MEASSSIESKTAFNPKMALVAAAVVLGSVALGFFLEAVFREGFILDPALWRRFLPLVLSFVLTVAFLTIFSVTSDRVWRAIGYGSATLGFGLAFFVGPAPVPIPMHFRLFLPFLYLGALLVLDYVSRRAVSTRSIFSSTMFGASYSRFFFFFTVIGGFLVYFSTQHSAVSQFKVPEEVLNPTLNFVVDRAIEQVQEQFGSQELSEEQFLEELKKTGLLEVLQEQFNITLGEGEVGTPDRLAQNLSESLREQLGQDLDLFIADFLGPYLPFIPLIASLGVALSLLFLTPVFTLFCIGVFELVYRGLVGLRVLKFEEETRQVRVLKIG